MPTLHLVRHGPTLLNEQDRLRGWMNPGLSHDGFTHAKELEGRLPSLPIYTSDLLRSVQTAEFIRNDFIRTPELRPWHVGIFAGQPSSLVHPRLTEYQKQPYVAVPLGETWNTFAQRFASFLLSIKHDAIIVTHYRCVKLAQAMAAMGWAAVDWDVMHTDNVAPLQVITLRTP